MGPERSRGSGTKRGKTAGKNKPRTEEFILSAQERILSVPGKFPVPQEKCSFLEERDQLNCTRKTQTLIIINPIIINLIIINLIISKVINLIIINLIIPKL